MGRRGGKGRKEGKGGGGGGGKRGNAWRQERRGEGKANVMWTKEIKGKL